MARRILFVLAMATLAFAMAPRSAPFISQAAATNAAACTLSGTATITPGLGATPKAVDFSFGGAISCQGTVKGKGSISGTGHCPSASLAACVPIASIGFSTSLGVTCGRGTLSQLTGLVVAECSTNKGPIVAVVLFTPNPVVQNPVRQVKFTGAAALG